MNSDLSKILELENAITRAMIKFPNGEMYGEVLAIVLKAFESKFGFFGFVNRNGDLVCPSMTRDVWVQCKIPDKDIIFPHDCWSGIWGQAMKEQKVLFKNDKASITPEGHIPIEKVVAAPLVHMGQLVGCIAIANKNENYTEEDASILERIAQRLAPLLHARLTRDAAIDDLKLSEFNYKTLLDLTPAIIVSLDYNGDITLLNKFGKRLLKCTNSCIGTNWFDNYIPEKDRERVKQVFEGLMKGETKDYTEFENHVLDTEGNEHIVYWKNQALRNELNNIIGTLSAGDDITDQREAERRLKEYWANEEKDLEEKLNKLSLLNNERR